MCTIPVAKKNWSQNQVLLLQNVNTFVKVRIFFFIQSHLFWKHWRFCIVSQTICFFSTSHDELFIPVYCLILLLVYSDSKRDSGVHKIDLGAIMQ